MLVSSPLPYQSALDAVLQQVQHTVLQAQRVASAPAALAQPRPALSLRGRGSHAHALPPPAHGAATVSTEGLRGIVDYAPSELVITAGAGTPLVELEAALAERGQYLPFEPPQWQHGGSLGGMVATGLAGPARASVGSVRDHVLGLHLVNGRGEHLQLGGQVIKNVAGYDLSRLMVGAMGTLGLITQVSLKVLARPPAEATLCLPLSQADALAQLQRWRGQALPLNASCWVHDPGAGQDLLFVRLRGAQAAVQAACQRMLADAQQLPSAPGLLAAHRMDTLQAARDWALCRDQQLPFFTQPPAGACLWRLSLPTACPALDWDYPSLVEWHGALRWVWAPPSAAQQLQQAAWRAGGSATVLGVPAGPWPDGLDPALRWGLHSRVAYGPPDSASADALWQIACRVKDAFDPWGVFNPDLMLRQD